MRKFIKKLREIDRGTSKVLNQQELTELKEFFTHKGYRIVAERKTAILVEGEGEHIINFPLTENDAVKLFKSINPDTFTRKTPLKDR